MESGNKKESPKGHNSKAAKRAPAQSTPQAVKKAPAKPNNREENGMMVRHKSAAAKRRIEIQELRAAQLKQCSDQPTINQKSLLIMKKRRSLVEGSKAGGVQGLAAVPAEKNRASIADWKPVQMNVNLQSMIFAESALNARTFSKGQYAAPSLVQNDKIGSIRKRLIKKKKAVPESQKALGKKRAQLFKYVSLSPTRTTIKYASGFNEEMIQAQAIPMIPYTNQQAYQGQDHSTQMLPSLCEITKRNSTQLIQVQRISFNLPRVFSQARRSPGESLKKPWMTSESLA